MKLFFLVLFVGANVDAGAREHGHAHAQSIFHSALGKKMNDKRNERKKKKKKESHEQRNKEDWSNLYGQDHSVVHNSNREKQH